MLRLSVAVCERYPTYDSAAYSFITMEREQDSIIMDAATRRNLKSPRTWRVVRKIRWLLCSTDRHADGQPYAETLAAYASARTRVLLERQQTIGALQDFTAGYSRYCVRSATWNVFWHVWLSNCSPTRSGPYAPRFPATAGLRAQLETVDSAPVQALREKMASLPSCAICWSEQSSTHRRSGTRRWCYRIGL